MLIFWEQRLAVLATPKTASSAIHAALEPLADVAVLRPAPLKHVSAPAFRRYLSPLLAELEDERFTVAAVMREPVSWLGSWYRSGIDDPEDETAPPAPVPDSFAAFVEGYCACPRAPFAEVGSQSAFLCADDGLAVDRLFRYEALEELTDFLEARLDCPITLPRLKVSREADLTLPQELAEHLRDVLASDLALYERLAAS